MQENQTSTGVNVLPHEIAARLGTSKHAVPQVVEPPAIIAQAEAAQNSPRTIADIIRAMVEVRDERRSLARRDKELVAEWEVLRDQLLAKMKEQGEDINSISSRTHTATKTKDPVPVVDDWDTFYDWLWETKSWHLLQRRIAVGAFREVIDSGGEIPGLHATDKVDISLTAR
jgi:hypothetical protein